MVIFFCSYKVIQLLVLMINLSTYVLLNFILSRFLLVMIYHKLSYRFKDSIIKHWLTHVIIYVSFLIFKLKFYYCQNNYINKF